MADRYAPTKTQKKESKQAGAIIGGFYGGMAGLSAGAASYGQSSRERKVGRYNIDFGRPAKGAHKWQEAARAKTKDRPNPNFNTKRWEKVNNLYERAQGGEKAAAGAAKERMLAGGEGPHIPGSKNPFLRALAHEHSPKVVAGAAGVATAAAVGTGLYHGTKKLAEHGYRQENKIAAERKHAMSKSAFGVEHEEVAKYWNPTTKTRQQNVAHGAKKGALIGGAISGSLGAVGGASAAGPTGALLGSAEGAIRGGLIGGGIGAAHGALRTNKDKIKAAKLKKSLELKPLVFDSSGNIVGRQIGYGQQRDPKTGPFGVHNGNQTMEASLKGKGAPKTSTAESASSSDLKTSGIQGRGKGKRDPQQAGIKGNTISKAFEPMTDEELNEILKGFGMGAIKTGVQAARGFAQFHGAGMANKAVGGYKAAKPKIGAGIKLAAANPGKTALATAGVSGAGGYGIGRKS